MNITFTGKIIASEPAQQGVAQSGTAWCSQSFVIEELNQQYPSRAVFQVYGSDKLQQFGIQVGEIITAHIGMKARQSSKDGRWFNQLDCWKVDRFGTQQASAQGQAQIYQSIINQPQPGGAVQQQAFQAPIQQAMAQQATQQPIQQPKAASQGALPF